MLSVFVSGEATMDDVLADCVCYVELFVSGEATMDDVLAECVCYV